MNTLTPRFCWFVSASSVSGNSSTFACRSRNRRRRPRRRGCRASCRRSRAPRARCPSPACNGRTRRAGAAPRTPGPRSRRTPAPRLGAVLLQQLRGGAAPASRPIEQRRLGVVENGARPAARDRHGRRPSLWMLPSLSSARCGWGRHWCRASERGSEAPMTRDRRRIHAPQLHRVAGRQSRDRRDVRAASSLSR